MKLMIVDDDARIRKMIAAVVSDLTTEIYECSDGKFAPETYAAYLPDWVMMDLLMPEVDGIAATQMIRSDYPDAKIIIVTTYESPTLRQNAASAGAIAYVLKENLIDLRKIISESQDQ